jgi:hypothetical protein
MSRKKPAPDMIRGGHQFSEKDMRQLTKLERIPVQPNRDALWSGGDACEHAAAAEPVRMSGRPAAWSRGLLPVTHRPCIPVVGTIISKRGRSCIRSIGLRCRRSHSDRSGRLVLLRRWVKNVAIKAERGRRLLGLSLNWRNQDSKDEAQECKTRHDSPPYCVLLITPSVLLDRACRLILLSKLSIDFDPSRAHGFPKRAAE